MGAAAVTGLVKGLMYVMLGAKPVGARIFLFWKTSRLLLHFESLGERQTPCDCKCLGGVLLSPVSRWQRSDALQRTHAQGNCRTRKSIPTRGRLHRTMNYAISTLATC